MEVHVHGGGSTVQYILGHKYEAQFRVYMYVLVSQCTQTKLINLISCAFADRLPLKFQEHQTLVYVYRTTGLLLLLTIVFYNIKSGQIQRIVMDNSTQYFIVRALELSYYGTPLDKIRFKNQS